MYTVEATACSYCDRIFKHKQNAKRHEKKCYKNPANKACATCSLFRKVEVDSDFYSSQFDY